MRISVDERELEALHRGALVIDSHNDAIVSPIRRGNLSVSGRRRTWPTWRAR